MVIKREGNPVKVWACFASIYPRRNVRKKSEFYRKDYRRDVERECIFVFEKIFFGGVKRDFCLRI